MSARGRAVTPRTPHRTRRLRVALFGPFGIGNLGNDASAKAMIALLRTLRPGVQITALSRHSADRDLLGVPMKGFTRATSGSGIAHRLTSKVGDLRRLLTLVSGFDVVVVPGTGLLEEPDRLLPGGELTWLLLVTLACALRGVPIAWFALGGARRMSMVPRLLASVAARSSGYLSFRDRPTARSLGRGPDRGVVVPDVVFGAAASLGAVAEVRDAPAAPVVAVAVMDYDPGDEESRLHYFAEVASAVETLIRRGWIVRFVVGDLADLAHAEVVRTALLERDRSLVVPPVTPLGDFPALVADLARCDVVVATRYHILLAAALAARPAIALSHAEKDDALLASLGLAGMVLPAATFTAVAAVERVESARRDGAGISDRLRVRTAEFADAVVAEFRRSGIGTGRLHR